MIQYTGTSSRSNYNDERTATIGPGWQLLRRLGVESSLLSSISFPPTFFLLFLYHQHALLSPVPPPSPPSPCLSPLYLLSFAFAPLPTGRMELSSVARRNKSKHLHRVVTGPRSHGGWILERFLDPPELSGGHRGGSLGRKCVISGIRARW